MKEKKTRKELCIVHLCTVCIGNFIIKHVWDLRSEFTLASITTSLLVLCTSLTITLHGLMMIVQPQSQPRHEYTENTQVVSPRSVPQPWRVLLSGIHRPSHQNKLQSDCMTRVGPCLSSPSHESPHPLPSQPSSPRSLPRSHAHPVRIYHKNSSCTRLDFAHWQVTAHL